LTRRLLDVVNVSGKILGTFPSCVPRARRFTQQSFSWAFGPKVRLHDRKMDDRRIRRDTPHLPASHFPVNLPGFQISDFKSQILEKKIGEKKMNSFSFPPFSFPRLDGNRTQGQSRNPLDVVNVSGKILGTLGSYAPRTRRFTQFFQGCFAGRTAGPSARKPDCVTGRWTKGE